MKLSSIVALASMAASTYADNGWRVRFYARTEFKGGAIVDRRGGTGTSLGCTNVTSPGGHSLQFEDSPANDTLTVWDATGCTGTSTTYTAPTNVATLSPTVLSFKVN